MNTVHKIYFDYDDSAGTTQGGGPMGLVGDFCNVGQAGCRDIYIGIYYVFSQCTGKKPDI